MTRILIALSVLLVPRAALACPVCFGQNDSPAAQAMNLGILAMLIIVAGVLASFASFVIYLVRRASLADSSRTESSGRPMLDGSDPQEGIAQC
jgi:hypothetical protein